MEPGHCYALPGQGGSIGIELSEPIIISHFTVEHLPFALTRAPSAPRAMALWGVRSSGEHTNLGTFEYIFSANSESSQTFELKEKHGPFRIVRLEVLSNYGMVQYTCVYRVRVHGEYAL
ncbi:hypothetical protein Zmor_012066 [Zophobas morio]|uniref:SUN domain-containing protein n=1 Tax=Zophobas morio TaxID=2755281 RepID=A0AA38HH02_9CUCU|nr:hypothetical protein Zmor_012066 [Zophobas morio]